MINEDPPGNQNSKDAPHAAGDDREGGQSVSPDAGAPANFPIVGIGASAGGLEAFAQLFTQMPTDAGIAFVLVQHLDPTHPSALTTLVKRYTQMSVTLVEDGMQMVANTIYIIPPDRDMATLNGRLHLMTPNAPRGLRRPIDFFFRSLAQDQRERAICIILSGTGSDGSLGVREIKGAGGMVMAQDPESAKYNGMPRSAIATGLVDFILPPEDMPNHLVAFVRRSNFANPDVPVAISQELRDTGKILVMLRAQTGHDFSYYKPTTIIRRIQRRMALNQVETIDEYLKILRSYPQEAHNLFKELLIGVTNFFRDSEAFQALAEHVIKPLCDNKAPDAPIRVWVPGCSTGEEAYSIAILFRQILDETHSDRKVQIFATDIDCAAIDVARVGVYPDSIIADVPQDILHRYFMRRNTYFEIIPSVRELILFATQSVIKDPPFSKIDLISCRNLLIYMKPELQQRILSLFHYALNSDKYLFLGSSETIGDNTDLFEELVRKWRIFRRKAGEQIWIRSVSSNVTGILSQYRDHALDIDKELRSHKQLTLKDIAEQKILKDYAPTVLIVNERYEILYMHGDAKSFLEITPGQATWSILRMIRSDLQLELTNALRKAVTNRVTVRVESIPYLIDETRQLVDLLIEPITEPPSMQGVFAVRIDTRPMPMFTPERDEAPSDRAPADDERLAEAERELQATKEYLRTTIAQLETYNEELMTTNEEMQSSNEEVQSTNQELQTSKEELQSMNEELSTVNTELETKIDALLQANSDLSNLIISIKMAILFLDVNLCVVRFTPMISDIVNLIETDVGRPFAHIAHNLVSGDLVANAKKVLDDLSEIEREVQSVNGKWFLVRIRPYRRLDNVIDGIVMTFTDISTQKRVQEELSMLAAIAEKSPYSIIVTNPDGIIEYVNRYFSEVSGFFPEDAIGKSVNIIKSGNTDAATYKALWSTIRSGSTWSGDMENKRKDGSRYWDHVTISAILDKDGQISHYVGIQVKLSDR
jgi:PAS domain S-box